MIYTAENEFFTLGVNELGAELTSLKSKKTLHITKFYKD